LAGVPGACLAPTTHPSKLPAAATPGGVRTASKLQTSHSCAHAVCVPIHAPARRQRLLLLLLLLPPRGAPRLLARRGVVHAPALLAQPQLPPLLLCHPGVHQPGARQHRHHQGLHPGRSTQLSGQLARSQRAVAFNQGVKGSWPQAMPCTAAGRRHPFAHHDSACLQRQTGSDSAHPSRQAGRHALKRCNSLQTPGRPPGPASRSACRPWPQPEAAFITATPR